MARKKTTGFEWFVRIFGLGIILLLWVGALVPNIIEDHYFNMNTPTIWVKWLGLVLLTVGGLGIVGWYDLEKMVTEWREADDRPAIKTMYIKIAQFIFCGIGIGLMAS